jgi:hypothetical protein
MNEMRVARLRAFLQSSVWREDLEPILQRRLEADLRAIAHIDPAGRRLIAFGSDSPPEDPDPILRLRIAMCRDLLHRPLQTLQKWEADLAPPDDFAEEEPTEADRVAARYGRQSPQARMMGEATNAGKDDSTKR